MLCRVVILNKFEDWISGDDSNFPLDISNTSKFSDDYQISAYANEAVYYMSMTEAKMFVTQVNDFKFFSFLEDDFVDLDELNLLANRLQYLDSKDLEKFECVADEFNIRNSRDLINLTANLHRFTLI